MISLTERDTELLQILTHKVSLLTFEQIAEAFYSHTSDPIRQARKRLKKLIHAGYVEKHTMLAHPPLELTDPVYRHKPGDEKPDLGKIAYKISQRWRKVLRPIDVAMATRQSRRIFGGYTSQLRPRASERSHDLSLSQVFLHFRAQNDLGAKWQGEGELRAKGISAGTHIPDARLVGAAADGSDVFIEFGGSYVKRKLGGIHEDLKDYYYELW